MDGLRQLLLMVLCIGMMSIPMLAQTEEMTPEVVTGMVSEAGAVSGTTVMMQPETSTLVAIGQIDGNVLVTSGFLLIALVVLSLLYTANRAIYASKDNTSTEAINQVLDGAINGLLKVWDKVGQDVVSSPTKVDDLLYAAGDLCVEALTELLVAKGFTVVPPADPIVSDPVIE